ncbi:MAG: PAS domain-containing protein [Archangiaceae bacterium]|nr:PAS domain-containing protein [Archangiaceae bacterium]
MTRGIPIALGALFLLLAAIVVGASRLIERDHALLLERFAGERARQVQQIAELSRLDLDGMAVVLRLAGDVTRPRDGGLVAPAALDALLVASPQLRLVRVFDAAGRTQVSAAHPAFSAGAQQSAVDGELRLAAARSLSRGGELELSAPLAVGDRSMRVYALSVAGADGRPSGAVAALVDSERLLARLGVLAADPALRVLFLGPRGRPTPSSDPLLAAVALEPARAPSPELARLLERLKAGEQGTGWLPATQAVALGLGEAEALAAFSPVRTDGLGTWSLVVVTSTSVLSAAEGSLKRRLGGAAAAAVLVLLAFGGLMVALARKSALAHERGVHAARLAQLHQRTERTLDNIPAAVLTLSRRGQVTAANRVLRERMTGQLPCTLAEALPNSPSAVVTRLSALVEQAAHSQVVQSLHGERLALFGSEGQYSVHAVPLGEPFHEAHALLVIEDVSEVHALESQLLRAEKLATIGVLAAGLAHEIGTPLGIVRARGEYVLGKLGRDHPQAHGLEVIVDQIDRVSRTIRRMLDFSRVTPAAVRPTAPAQVGAWLGEVLRYEAQRRKVELRIALAETLPRVSADPDQLQQLLLNLVMNACDACDAGGHVTLSASRDTATSGWPCVRFEVLDDGCGIQPEHRQGVFDPFFTTKKRGQGTGLGLTVAAQIVRNHGGEIELTSEVGEGTRVSVYWPLAGPTPLEPRDEQPS